MLTAVHVDYYGYTPIFSDKRADPALQLPDVTSWQKILFFT